MLFPLDTIIALMYLESMLRDSSFGRHPGLPASLGILLLFIFTAIITSSAAGFFFRRYILSTRPGGARLRHLAGSFDLAVRGFIVVTYIFFLRESGLHISLARTFPAEEYIQTHLQAILTFCCFIPYILLFILTWLPLYRLHCMTTPGSWSIGSYLLHKIRYGLFIIGVWIPMLAGATFFGEAYSLFLLFPLVVWIFPFFLRFFWGCRRLEDGTLRNRIVELQQKAGVTFSEIYVWDLGGGAIMNAAAVGLFRPFCYLFLSNSLISQMTDTEIDGVVCHELGHVRHRHLLFYMAMTFTFSGLLMSSLYQLPADFRYPLMVLSLCLYFRVCFGYASRRMERQADLFSLETLDSSAPLVDALERIAIGAGNIRFAHSWHHISIAERVAFLKAAETHPQIGSEHNQRVRKLMRSGYSVVLVALLLLCYEGLAYSTNSTSPRDNRQELARRLELHQQRLRIFVKP